MPVVFLFVKSSVLRASKRVLMGRQNGTPTDQARSRGSRNGIYALMPLSTCKYIPSLYTPIPLLPGELYLTQEYSTETVSTKDKPSQMIIPTTSPPKSEAKPPFQLRLLL